MPVLSLTFPKGNLAACPESEAGGFFMVHRQRGGDLAEGVYFIGNWRAALCRCREYPSGHTIISAPNERQSRSIALHQPRRPRSPLIDEAPFYWMSALSSEWYCLAFSRGFIEESCADVDLTPLYEQSGVRKITIFVRNPV